MLVGLRGAHLAELPDRGPKALDLAYRPAAQLLVVLERTGARLVLGDPAHETRHARPLALRGGRLPQRPLPCSVPHHASDPLTDIRPFGYNEIVSMTIRAP